MANRLARDFMLILFYSWFILFYFILLYFIIVYCYFHLIFILLLSLFYFPFYYYSSLRSKPIPAQGGGRSECESSASSPGRNVNVIPASGRNRFRPRSEAGRNAIPVHRPQVEIHDTISASGRNRYQPRAEPGRNWEFWVGTIPASGRNDSGPGRRQVEIGSWIQNHSGLRPK